MADEDSVLGDEHSDTYTFHRVDPSIEEFDAKIQVARSGTMDDDHHISSLNYENVEVLILSWDREVKDVEMEHEFDDLSSIFQGLYNFHTTQRTMKRREKKRAQTQVNSIVATWVDEYDGPKGLLIVYFAGHGERGDQHITESCLHEIQSDVLQILDCCYAGALDTYENSSQSFEYLAATGANDMAAGPGATSFTSALIWALKSLVRNVPFTTIELLKRILVAPNFRDNQKPRLSKLLKNDRRIMLHPLKPKTDAESKREGPRAGSI